MKKILSILLVMALCLGLFAACNANPTEPATSNLANAKKLVFNTYKPASKDEVPVKSADFELLSSVLVEGVSYPVEWTVSVTAGPADAVKLDGNKVDLTEKPAEEVKFTLTATIKDEKGNTETVSFNFMTPAFEAPAADKVVIKNVAENKYATGIEYKYTSSSGKVKMELPLTESKAEAIAFTLVNNDDGSVSFKTDCGKYLFCDANSVEFADEMGDYTKFILDVAEGGYYVKCAVANYNGNPQYLEIYSGYLTCYGLNDSSNHDLYIFALEDAAGAAGKVEKYTEGSAPETTVPPTQDSNDPAADSSLSIKDAIALGASKAHNTYTAGKYYVTGVITEVYNEQYGNMKITDAEGNILTIYGTYDADGTNRYDAMAVKPVAGDTVTIYGIVGQYNDTPQIKNGWITAHTPAGETPAAPETTAPAAPETTAPAAPETTAPAGATTGVVGAPEAGKAYKFGMVQGNVGQTFYLAGGMDGYYMATTTDMNAAIDVYLEATEGGYYFYTMIDGTKTYINMVVSGTHVNGAYEAAATTVYTFDAESKTLIAVVDGIDYWFATRNDKSYTTMGPCKTEYEGFYGQFYG